MNRRRLTVEHTTAVPWPGTLAALVLAWLLTSGVSAAAEPSTNLALTNRERYGFVATSPDWLQAFDFAQLRAGWYVNFAQPVCDPAPGGMKRAQVLRVYAGQTVNPGRLGPLVDDYPGTLWLIGNEPDCIWQDNVWPEEYARIYHDLYAFIKSHDPTSQVSPGGIVQPTPLRLQWLDRVLAAYQSQYGSPLPVDVWNIHNAILNEQRGSWGADIPPGLDAEQGVVRAVDDNDNMTIFADQIRAFRQWMADNGYGGYPLIVTEYGVLMPDDYGFDVNRVNAFMTATFDFFETATDAALGDPNDGYHLVQRWAWYSLDTPPWNPVTGEGFNGNLFDPDTTAITAFGQHYASHTSSFPSLSYVDLSFDRFKIAPIAALASPSQTITRSLEVGVANLGTLDSGNFALRLAYDGPLSGVQQTSVTSLPPGATQWLPFTLANLPPGRYDLAVEIDPAGLIIESLECNNRASGTLLAPTDRLYLPLIGRQFSAISYQLSAFGYQVPPSNTQHPIPDTRYLIPDTQSPLGFQEYDLPTANGYPAQIALDAQGRVWISERDGNKIARFDPAGQTWQEYDIPTPGSQPWGLALDAAGNVWFAETAANRIGELNVGSGAIAEYAVPTANSEPWDVAVGSGAIWFTEKAGNKIGRLTPFSGAIAEYALPTPDAQPTGLAVSGGYVWFTEAAGSKIARLDSTTGQIDEKSRPAGSVPQDLVLTSAGKPWFTEQEANRIVLFDPSTLGWVLEVAIATANSQPYGISLEGNIAVWFTERAGNRLGRFSGSIPPREFSLPTPDSLPTGIVIDSAGCAWYTAPGANRIGQLCPTFQHYYLPLIAKKSVSSPQFRIGAGLAPACQGDRKDSPSPLNQ